MSLRIVLLVVVGIFPVSEMALAIFKRANAGTAQVDDRGSMRILWGVIALSICLAIASQWVRGARMPLSSHVLASISLVLLLAGLAIRWTAILTLGRFFTVDVAIHTDHALVQSGLYGLVRHPSYSGLLLSFLGLGVFFRNWLSILALMVPISAAVLNRIATEERALLEALGEPYAEYCKRTKRLIPWLL